MLNESAKSRGLRGLRASNFYEGRVSYVGQNIFYVGLYFTWVIIFYVGYVSQTFLRGLRGSNIFFRGSLRGSKYFSWVNFFCVGLLLSTR